MKTGLLIPSFNRPEYLEQCLDSLSKVEPLADLTVILLDDGSTNHLTHELIQNFKLNWAKVDKLFLRKNQGIKHSLRIGFNYLFSSDCDICINLDSDAIVKPQFLKVLKDLKTRFPDSIVSGFNTLTTDPRTKKVRHPIAVQNEDHCIKQSIGGINMVLNRANYTEWVLPSLIAPGHWDWNVCRKTMKFIVSTPSIVQHIGIEKGINLNNPDTAFDF